MIAATTFLPMGFLSVVLLSATNDMNAYLHSQYRLYQDIFCCQNRMTLHPTVPEHNVSSIVIILTAICLKNKPDIPDSTKSTSISRDFTTLRSVRPECLGFYRIQRGDFLNEKFSDNGTANGDLKSRAPA